jgi:hypothetical protein
MSDIKVFDPKLTNFILSEMSERGWAKISQPSLLVFEKNDCVLFFTVPVSNDRILYNGNGEPILTSVGRSTLPVIANKTDVLWSLEKRGYLMGFGSISKNSYKVKGDKAGPSVKTKWKKFLDDLDKLMKDPDNSINCCEPKISSEIELTEMKLVQAITLTKEQVLSVLKGEADKDTQDYCDKNTFSLVNMKDSQVIIILGRDDGKCKYTIAELSDNSEVGAMLTDSAYIGTPEELVACIDVGFTPCIINSRMANKTFENWTIDNNPVATTEKDLSYFNLSKSEEDAVRFAMSNGVDVVPMLQSGLTAETMYGMTAIELVGGDSRLVKRNYSREHLEKAAMFVSNGIDLSILLNSSTTDKMISDWERLSNTYLKEIREMEDKGIARKTINAHVSKAIITGDRRYVENVDSMDTQVIMELKEIAASNSEDSELAKYLLDFGAQASNGAYVFITKDLLREDMLTKLIFKFKKIDNFELYGTTWDAIIEYLVKELYALIYQPGYGFGFRTDRAFEMFVKDYGVSCIFVDEPVMQALFVNDEVLTYEKSDFQDFISSVTN